MRVLHVIDLLSGRGGAEISLRGILLGTQGPGLTHAVVVLYPEDRSPASDDLCLAVLAAAGIPTFEPPAPLRSLAARVRHVQAAIRAFQPDLVHTTLYEAGVAGRLAARMSRVPVLTSLVNTPYTPDVVRHCGVHPLKLHAVRWIDSLLSRHATSAFHAITNVVADHAVAALGIDRRSITVVPRGRSLAHLGARSGERRRAARAGLGLTDDAPVLINVARHDAQKGQIYLLDALVDVRRRHPRAVLLLVGRPGNRTAALERRIDELGLHGAVRTLGHRDDVGDLLCASDVFVFPSLYEGLGGAVLEAMALRVPIVASEAPALREVLAGGSCGLLVPVADVPALARAICEVLEDEDAARRRVAAAAARFESTYNLAACLEGMRGLYTSLGRHGGGDPAPVPVGRPAEELG
jgi:glycosyltransferase involved in cell wall biosynthesis